MSEVRVKMKNYSPMRRFLGRKSVATLFMLACFAGASLLGLHWSETPWAVGTAELAGLSGFSPLSAGLAEQLQKAGADPWLPVLGITLLATGGLLGWVVAASRLARRLSVAAAWALLVLAGVHIAEELLLNAAVRTAPSGQHLWAYVLWLQGVAFLGFSLLPIAGLVALLGGFTTLIRLVVWEVNRSPKIQKLIRRLLRQSGIEGQVKCAHEQVKAADRMTPRSQAEGAHWFDTAALPSSRIPGGLGICLSGGGIRSATFGLGALQALQQSPSMVPGQGSSELTRARYLTAVSGGAYAAGALLLATHPGENPTEHHRGASLLESAQRQDAALDFDQVFRPGSPEFDHLRKHSSYIADSFREWVIAIFVVIRGAFFSMIFLGLIALTAGRWTGLLYHQIKRIGDLQSPWHPVWGAVFATIGVAVVALLLWLASTRLTLSHKRAFEVTNQNLSFWRFWLFVLKSPHGTQGATLQQR